MPRSRTLRAVLPLAGLAWAATVGAGIVVLHSYEATPGRPGEAPATWPDGSRVRLDPERANLVMLAHPRCPCSRASLEGLSRLMGRRGVTLAAHVLFFRPGSARGGWGREGLRERAATIPGVQVLDDPDGEEAARFGAETSGAVRLYDRRGRLLFAGGITAARGEVGDSPGLDSVVAHLGGKAGSPATPVFGCSIRGDSARDEGSSDGK